MKPSAGKVVFGEVAESWLAGKVNLSASTRARYRSALDVHLLPAFGSVPLSDITPERIRRWIAGAAVSSSAATVRKNHTVLHQVPAQAVTDGRLHVNTAAELELPTIDETEKRYLTAGQIRGLADAAGDHGALVLLLGFTGLRFGEAAALTGRDIDLVHGRVRVHRSVTAVGGKMVYSAPKSHQARTVPFPGSWSTLYVIISRIETSAPSPSRIRAADRCARECPATMVGSRGAGFRRAGRAVSA